MDPYSSGHFQPGYPPRPPVMPPNFPPPHRQPPPHPQYAGPRQGFQVPYFPQPEFQGYQWYGSDPYGYGPPPFQNSGPGGFHPQPPRGFRGRPFPPRGQYVPRRGGPHKRYRDNPELRHDVPGTKRNVGSRSWDSDPYYDKSMFEDPWKDLLPAHTEIGSEITSPAVLPPQAQAETVGEANTSAAEGEQSPVALKDDSKLAETEETRDESIPVKEKAGGDTDTPAAEVPHSSLTCTLMESSAKGVETETGYDTESSAPGIQLHVPQSEAVKNVDQSPGSGLNEDPVRGVHVVTESSTAGHDTNGSSTEQPWVKSDECCVSDSNPEHCSST